MQPSNISEEKKRKMKERRMIQKISCLLFDEERITREELDEVYRILAKDTADA